MTLAQPPRVQLLLAPILGYADIQCSVGFLRSVRSNRNAMAPKVGSKSALTKKPAAKQPVTQKPAAAPASATLPKLKHIYRKRDGWEVRLKAMGKAGRCGFFKDHSAAVRALCEFRGVNEHELEDT